MPHTVCLPASSSQALVTPGVSRRWVRVGKPCLCPATTRFSRARAVLDAALVRTLALASTWLVGLSACVTEQRHCQLVPLPGAHFVAHRDFSTDFSLSRPLLVCGVQEKAGMFKGSVLWAHLIVSANYLLGAALKRSPGFQAYCLIFAALWLGTGVLMRGLAGRWLACIRCARVLRAVGVRRKKDGGGHRGGDTELLPCSCPSPPNNNKNGVYPSPPAGEEGFGDYDDEAPPPPPPLGGRRIVHGVLQVERPPKPLHATTWLPHAAPFDFLLAPAAVRPLYHTLAGALGQGAGPPASRAAQGGRGPSRAGGVRLGGARAHQRRRREAAGGAGIRSIPGAGIWREACLFDLKYCTGFGSFVAGRRSPKWAPLPSYLFTGRRQLARGRRHGEPHP